MHNSCYLKVLCPAKQLASFLWISRKSLDLEATLQQCMYSSRAAASNCLTLVPMVQNTYIKQLPSQDLTDPTSCSNHKCTVSRILQNQKRHRGFVAAENWVSDAADFSFSGKTADGLMISSFTTVPATVIAFGCLSFACELKHRREKLCTGKCRGARACEPLTLLVERLQRVR